MKGAGWLGILMIAAGALLIWAGYEGVSIIDAIRSILNNEPLPRAKEAEAEPEATPGNRGLSGFTGSDTKTVTADSGSGASGGGGGGW